MIEISVIRMDHIHWSEQIQNALKKGKLPEVTSYRDCEFGKWLHGDEKKLLSNTKELAELEKKHERFHTTAAEMVNFIKLRDFDNAEILLGEFRRESKDLIFLLSLLEYRLIKSNKSI